MRKYEICIIVLWFFGMGVIAYMQKNCSTNYVASEGFLKEVKYITSDSFMHHEITTIILFNDGHTVAIERKINVPFGGYIKIWKNNMATDWYGFSSGKNSVIVEKSTLQSDIDNNL